MAHQPVSKVYWVTCCKECGWEDEEAHEDRADCTDERCPECESDRLFDRPETY